MNEHHHNSTACPFAVGDLVQVRPQVLQQTQNVAQYAGHIGVVTKMRMDHDADWSLVWISGAEQPFFEDELRSLQGDLDALTEAMTHHVELHGRSRCCLCGEAVIDLRDAQ